MTQLVFFSLTLLIKHARKLQQDFCVVRNAFRRMLQLVDTLRNVAFAAH